MEPQLVLISETETPSHTAPVAPPPQWRLDDITKALGYRGIAQARAALQRATARAAELNRQHVQEPAA